MTNINMMTLLTEQMLAKGLDIDVTLGTKVTLEVNDINSGKAVAIISGSTLEEAYANLFGTCVSSVRDAKLGRAEGLSVL